MPGARRDVTPFNGEHKAGIQVLNTSNFPDLHRPALLSQTVDRLIGERTSSLDLSDLLQIAMGLHPTSQHPGGTAEADHAPFGKLEALAVSKTRIPMAQESFPAVPRTKSSYIPVPGNADPGDGVWRSVCPRATGDGRPEQLFAARRSRTSRKDRCPARITMQAEQRGGQQVGLFDYQCSCVYTRVGNHHESEFCSGSVYELNPRTPHTRETQN